MSVKLSECTKPDQILLYNEEVVSLQYVLRKIFNNQKLPEIRLCSNQKQLDNAIEKALESVYKDTQQKEDKEYYSLGAIDTIPVEVDITKEDVKQIDKEGYKFVISIQAKKAR